jgi:hypothetical protein
VLSSTLNIQASAASLPYLSNDDLCGRFRAKPRSEFCFIQKMKERSCAHPFLSPTTPLTVSTSTANSVRTFRAPFVLLCPVSFIENPIKEHTKKLENSENPQSPIHDLDRYSQPHFHSPPNIQSLPLCNTRSSSFTFDS